MVVIILNCFLFIDVNTGNNKFNGACNKAGVITIKKFNIWNCKYLIVYAAGTNINSDQSHVGGCLQHVNTFYNI